MRQQLSGSRTNRSAMRRRSGFVAAPTAKKLAPYNDFDWEDALLAPTTTKVIKPLNKKRSFLLRFFLLVFSWNAFTLVFLNRFTMQLQIIAKIWRRKQSMKCHRMRRTAWAYWARMAEKIKELNLLEFIIKLSKRQATRAST